MIELLLSGSFFFSRTIIHLGMFHRASWIEWPCLPLELRVQNQTKATPHSQYPDLKMLFLLGCVTYCI